MTAAEAAIYHSPQIQTFSETEADLISAYTINYTEEAIGIALAANEPWTKRIHALRANASCKSHSELDEATQLDQGNPKELGKECARLQQILTNLNIFGGCCGTDHRHVESICKNVASLV